MSESARLLWLSLIVNATGCTDTPRCSTPTWEVSWAGSDLGTTFEFENTLVRSVGDGSLIVFSNGSFGDMQFAGPTLIRAGVDGAVVNARSISDLVGEPGDDVIGMEVDGTGAPSVSIANFNSETHRVLSFDTELIHKWSFPVLSRATLAVSASGDVAIWDDFTFRIMDPMGAERWSGGVAPVRFVFSNEDLLVYSFRSNRVLRRRFSVATGDVLAEDQVDTQSRVNLQHTLLMQDGSIVFATDPFESVLSRLDPATGVTHWTRPMGTTIDRLVLATNGDVFGVTSVSTQIAQLDAATGETKRVFDNCRLPPVDPVIGHIGTQYVGQTLVHADADGYVVGQNDGTLARYD